MTLLELLVALAIFAIVGAALFPVINGALLGRDRATRRVAIDSEARLILDRLEQDVLASVDAGFTGPLPKRFVAAASPTQAADAERVLLEATTLVARGVTPVDAFVGGEDVKALAPDRGDLAEVQWRIDADGRLLRQEIRPPTTDAVDWTQVPFEVLSEHAAVAMEFYDPGNWLESWDSTEAGPHHAKAPVAVRTTIHVGDDDTSVDLVSTVVLPTVESTTDLRRPGGSNP